MEVFYFAGVFEAALLSGFTQGSEYLSLWIAFLDYLKRRINWDKGKLIKLITDAIVIIRISLYAVCISSKINARTGGTNNAFYQIRVRCFVC